MSSITGTLPPGAGGVLMDVIAVGLLNVGPGGTPTGVASPTSAAPAVGVYGYLGFLDAMPSQTSSPPFSCAVYGNGGVVGVNNYSGTISDPDPNGDGIMGFGGGNGVHGFSVSGTGVAGTSTSGDGVTGVSVSGHAVVGTVTGTTGAEAVVGVAASGVGVLGETTNGIAGVVGVSNGTGLAGRFDGNVQNNGNVSISGNITSVGTITATTVTVSNDVLITGGEDCAEHFETNAAVLPEPGTIVVIDEDGTLCESAGSYDKRVAGVVSGAGEYRPAIVLGPAPSRRGVAVALVGKVFCKVDAEASPISVGDLLTTSDRPGFAMKADDATRAFGAVIGKALRPLARGQSMIPILVALQ